MLALGWQRTRTFCPRTIGTRLPYTRRQKTSGVNMRVSLLWSLLLTGLVSGCAGDGLSQVGLKGQVFRVEVVADEAGRTRGLMFREQMPAKHGMLFVFPDSAPRRFWMYNTRIPLDILYFDSNRGFVSGQYRVPGCGSLNSSLCPNYPSAGLARYVLELNAGVGAALGLSPGDLLELPEDLPTAR